MNTPHAQASQPSAPFGAAGASQALKPQPEGCSPQSLSQSMGTQASPLLFDVRRKARFDGSERMIAGATWIDPDQPSGWPHPSAGQNLEVVTYCVYGHGVGVQAAQQLCSLGWQASHLLGGMNGGQAPGDEPDDNGIDAGEQVAAWRNSPLLTFRKRPDWGVDGIRTSMWITRERPKIDRIACPWLIRRFVDTRAQFAYVPTAQVLTQAKATGAVAYDIPGAPVSHVGELCSFDALLAGFDLHCPALDMLARVVRGADTDRLGLAPQSAGLLAMSLGLSKVFATDDRAMLEAAMPLYDGLYAWCKGEAAGAIQDHNWRPLA